MVPITDRVPFPLFLLQSSTEIGLVYVIMIVMMCRGAREAGPEEQPHIISDIATAVFFQRNFCFCQRSSYDSQTYRNSHRFGKGVSSCMILALIYTDQEHTGTHTFSKCVVKVSDLKMCGFLYAPATHVIS